MIAEFQTTSDRLLKMVQKTFRDQLSATVIDPLALVGQTVWVEHVKLNRDSERQLSARATN